LKRQISVRFPGYSTYLLVFFTLFACVKSNEVIPAKEDMFIKFFGGFDAEQGYGARQTSDGGFICIGSTSSRGAGAMDVYLLKTDMYGNKLWEKTFGTGGNDQGKAIEELPDGGYILLAELTNTAGYTHTALIRTDNKGDKLWEKIYANTGEHQQAHSLKLTLDGGMLLLGNVLLNDGSSAMQLIKTDSEGTKQWGKLHDVAGLKDDVGAVQQTKEGNLIWCGADYRTKTGSTGSDMRVVLTNEQGIVLWDKSYGKENKEEGRDIQMTDKGYIVVGTSFSTVNKDSDVYVVSLFDDGTVRWSRNYELMPGSGLNDHGESIYPTKDGGYIIAGSSERAEGGSDIFLLKINARGEEQWKKSFGGRLADIGKVVRPTADGGYMVFGTITFENNNMLCLIKTDAKGELVNK
jgi:hypothetical protein